MKSIVSKFRIHPIALTVLSLGGCTSSLVGVRSIPLVVTGFALICYLAVAYHKRFVS